jgi:hypothetical protein
MFVFAYELATHNNCQIDTKATIRGLSRAKNTVTCIIQDLDLS